MKNAVFVYAEEFQTYKFGDHHPFNQARVELTTDLLKKTGALKMADIVKARKASDEELNLVHDQEYIEAVKKAGHGLLDETIALNYGLGTEDTPIFQNMHEASAHIVGATLTAADYVMEGKANHALNLGGGLHHGFRGKASGFCVYNDTSVAIKYLQKKYGARVLYIDTDAHHGDGVQWTFYDDPEVCTLSIHETGRYLFPGTGNINERGHGKGFGYSFNVPLDAFTEDESFIDSYTQTALDVAAFFKPDVIVTQNGVDAHYFDPLSHLSATMASYKVIPKIAHDIAHRYCEGRWIATGGGGYDIWRVVPRAWSFVWLEMIDKLEEFGTGAISTAWLEKWQKLAPVPLPKTWDDQVGIYEPIPRKQEITEKNHIAVTKLLQFIKSEKN